MRDERITFDNGRGQMLAGRLDEPEGTTPRAWALFAHCFTCSKNLKAVRHVASGLESRGFGVLSFDFTGLGESEGEFAETGFSADVEDLLAASRWLSAERRGPELLIGHSLGGAAVLTAAARLNSPRAVATVGAPADPEHVTRLFRDRVETIEREGSAEISIGGRPFRVTRSFLEDLRTADVLGAAGRLSRPLMLFHSPTDPVVGIDNARRLYEAARHPKSFISLNGADHLLSRERDGRFVAEILAAWAGRYLENEAEGRAAGGAATADGAAGG